MNKQLKMEKIIVNEVAIDLIDIDRIEQDNESLHIILKESISDSKYEEICNSVSEIYPEILDMDYSIMWYPITTESFQITFTL